MKNSETSIKNTDRLIITRHAPHNHLAESDKTTHVHIKLETLHFHLSQPKDQTAQAKLDRHKKKHSFMLVYYKPIPSKTNSRLLLSMTPFFYRLICSFKINHTCFSLSSRLPNNPKEDAFRSPTIDHTITESLST